MIANSDLDASLATLESAQAAVQGDKATITKMHIVAPFAGKLGIRQVSVGQYVAQQGSTTSIVSISSIDPMLVQFSLPQQNLPNLTIGQAIQLTVQDADPQRAADIANIMVRVLIDQNEIIQTGRYTQTEQSIQAQITQVENQIKRLVYDFCEVATTCGCTGSAVTSSISSSGR